MRCANPIRTRAENECRTMLGLANRHPIGQRSYIICQRIILDSQRQRREQLIRQGRAKGRAIDLIGDRPQAKYPTVRSLTVCPAHGAAFTWSERSARDRGWRDSFCRSRNRVLVRALRLLFLRARLRPTCDNDSKNQNPTAEIVLHKLDTLHPYRDGGSNRPRSRLRSKRRSAGRQGCSFEKLPRLPAEKHFGRSAVRWRNCEGG
jgi:hypothetical protein